MLEVSAIFRSLDISLEEYVYQNWQHPNAVYLRIPFLRASTEYWYIGSTHDSLAGREQNRHIKHRQIQAGKLVHVELAQRWWKQQGNFFTYVTILICSDVDNSAETQFVYRTKEACLIARLQPTLNYPYVQRCLRRTSLGFVKTKLFSSKHRRGINGIRLFRRLRKRAHGSDQHHTSNMLTMKFSIRTITALASRTKKSWDTQKLLAKTNLWTNDELYILWRMVQNFEQPARSLALGVLHKTFELRKLTKPKSAQSLAIPFLAHPAFRKHVQAFLQRITVQCKSFALPFHLPPHKIRESAHGNVAGLLFNFRSWNESFKDGRPSRCNCHAILSNHPELDTVDGHIASSAKQLSHLSSLQKEMLSCHGKSLLFDNKHRIQQKWWQSFCHWYASGFPLDQSAVHSPWDQVSEQFHQFFEEQWQLHMADISLHPRFQAAEAAALKHTLTDQLVIHCEDHKPFHICLYCPQLYYDTSYKTWNDRDVFTKLEISPIEFTCRVPVLIKAIIRKRYSWGIKLPAVLPTAYLLLKRKKQFQAARTIIDYSQFCMAKLLKAVSIALEDILKYTWPETYGHLTTPQIWQEIHAFLTEASEHEWDIDCINDDLVGFFNAVPQDDIIASVDRLLTDYINLTGTAMHNLTFQVDLQSKCTKDRVIAGSISPFDHLNCKTVHATDFIEIIKTSFRIAVFVVWDQCYSQTRGTPIGSQISPVLSSIAVCSKEVTWRRQYRTWLQNFQHHMKFVRYVDNRFGLFKKALIQSKALQAFLHTYFYKHPVELEPVADTVLLGFDVDPILYQVRYIMPDQDHQFRSMKSAGSINLTLSGLRSRVSLIKKYSFPQAVIQQQLKELAAIYVNRSFPHAQVSSICK